MGIGRIPPGLLVLGLALVAIYFRPLNDLLLAKCIQYGIPIPQPTVTNSVRGITYVGTYSTAGVEHYQNIFYAAEPTGDRRFAPPVPIDQTPGSVVDATAPGAWCPQGTGDVLPFTSKVVNISENCLSLRIARSRGVSPDARLPVVVWIHGGGHALGSASEILYTPDGLVTQARTDGRPLIYVAINYRLGVFGFATGDALLRDKHTNAGLRDQRAALEWVRENIGAFGGDPNRVTAIGQSVGASDISLQLTAFDGEQDAPFQQAVMMSGALGLNFNTDSDLVAKNTATLAKQVGCTDQDNDQSAPTLHCLRHIPFEILSNASVSMSRAARPPFGEAFFYPTLDNDFIRDRPTELMRQGKYTRNIPVILSWVVNDGAWYASPTTSTDEEVLASFGRWLFNLSPATNQRLLALYPVSDFEHMVRPEDATTAQYYRAAQMNRDIWFTCPVLDFAWHYVRGGGVGRDMARVYVHNATRFAPSYEMMGTGMWRVAHLSDIPYVLNVAELGGRTDNSPQQLKLAREMSRAIVRFVDGGNGDAWPAVFHDVNSQELLTDFPARFTLQLFGGPHGGQVVTVDDNDGVTAADEAMRWEKLTSRCAFINGAQMREEAGV
ncbi:alpha/beta-hydrolase [Penicillium capsulatum]|nr:alpha/beta-hydrolase [Penicillium capsulatum]